MFCQMCGSKLPDGARVCPVCGASVPNQIPVQNLYPQNQQYNQMQPQQMNPQQVQPQQVQPQREMMQEPRLQEPIPQEEKPQKEKSQKAGLFSNKKTAAVVIVSAISIFLALGALFFVKLFWVPTVRIDKYITITADGYSSVGTVNVKFDEDAFYNDFDKSIRYKGVGPGNKDQYYNAAECLYREYLKGELDKPTNVSNGDTINYVWTIDEEAVADNFKVKLDIRNVPYTVSGLSEAETFDIFQDITVEFDGSAPNGTVRIYNDSNVYPVSNWTFVADKADGLSNGDKINVYIEDVDAKIKECVDECGKIPSATTKEFEVSGLISVATSINQISEDAMNLMKKTAEDGLTSTASSDWYDEVSLDSMTYVGAFFLKAKPDSDAETTNTIKLVYVVDTSVNREDEKQKVAGTFGYYYFVEFSNISINDDGSCDVDLGSYNIPQASAVFETESKDYYFDGYEDYKTLFTKEVTAYSDRYDNESTVNETVKPVEENVTYTDTAKKTEKKTEKKSDKKTEKKSDKKSAKKKKETTKSDGQIFADSSTRYLTDEEVKKLSDSEIQTAINEIYARNGYKFQDQSIYDYFSQYSWYKPKTSSQDEVLSKFSEIENANVALLQSYR